MEDPKQITDSEVTLVKARELSDYNSSSDFSAQEAQDEIRRAEKFVEEVEPFLASFTES